MQGMRFEDSTIKAYRTEMLHEVSMIRLAKRLRENATEKPGAARPSSSFVFGLRRLVLG